MNEFLNFNMPVSGNDNYEFIPESLCPAQLCTSHANVACELLIEIYYREYHIY